MFNNEEIEDVLISGTSTIVLTKSGNLYGWGTQKYIGIGNSSEEIVNTPEKLSISNVKKIICGNNFFIAVKNDGTVWGTGNNSNGVLGRWIKSDGTYSNSNFETAFEWVRCPNLEK
ncbi:Regulator of chromosome condensation (RCC1) repeat protein [compost metagenome]